MKIKKPKMVAIGLLIRVVYALRFLIVKTYAKADAGSLCTADDDCPDQMICSNGFCMPAIPTRNRCYSEHHCSYQERCRYQTCWTIMCKENCYMSTSSDQIKEITACQCQLQTCSAEKMPTVLQISSADTVFATLQLVTE
ncbi:conserved hypothetical protein [Trichinella spiralis]|uniref:hypothetical protein n=1 Tax=Trichinella spiralis TaxID=6334 RepID=UPI0001EFC1DB|nr:conserved hypothetical protein [Trichinella spiralis]